LLKDYLSPQAYQQLQARKLIAQATNPAAGAGGGLPLDYKRPVNWIAEHFRIPETDDKRLRLHAYQTAVLAEALRTDDHDQFIYSVVLWSDIKKSIKSTIAAAVILWRAYHTPYGQFLIIANDLKQADSRVGYYFRRAIELHPILRDECKVRNYRVEMANKATIEAIPIDPTGEAGSNADMVVFSELWGAHQTAQKRMWTETTLPPQKFGYSQRWIETYAGYSGESELLEQLYQIGVKDGRPITLSDAPPDLELFANDSARLLALWNTKPRLSWQTPPYYAQEQAILTPEEFDRVHRNQWSSSTEKFIDIEWWNACQGVVKALDKKTPLVLAMDAGVSSDCFALVATYREGDHVYVPYAHIWTPPKGGKLDFSLPEAEVRRLCREYHILSVAYDPYQLHDMATRLAPELGVPFHEFSQGADRLEADKQLYDRIRERRITHNDDPDLREHIQNANRKTDPENGKLRIIKRADHLKIDACVTLSMATEEIMRYTY
jgi:phage terminase large subunit-like protein